MIRKTSETRALAGTVVNTYSESQTSAYSCNYVNPKLLWANPNPTSSFSNQNITLSSSDYDMLLVIYEQSTNNRRLMSQIVPKGETIRLFGVGYGTEPQAIFRNIDYTDSTTLAVGSCLNNNSTDNSANIPLYVIGYKTGLF